MSKTVLPCLLLVVLSTPIAARGSAVYVPPVPLSEDAAGALQTEVSVSNASAVKQHVSWIERERGAVQRGDSRIAIAAGAESVLRAPATASGLLELSGDPGLLFEARVTRGHDTVVELPVINAERAYRGGQTVSLLDLYAAPSLATHVEIVSLSQAGNRCTLALSTTDGAALGPLRSLTLEGLEARSFLDVFAEVDTASGASDARVAVTCGGDFYAFALVADEARDRIDLVTPMVTELSVDQPTEIEPCSAGASCFDAPGLVFVPEAPPGMPVGRVRFPAPPGAVKRLVLSLDLKVGDWYKDEPGGKHLAYWFVIKENPDMPGMLYLRGPGKNQAFVVHGLRLKHAQKKRIIKPFAAVVGKTYHIVNDYDLAGGVYTVTISDAETGEIGVVVRGKPNLDTFVIKPKAPFLVDMGFYPDRVPHEVPSYGWRYSDLHIEAFMAE